MKGAIVFVLLVFCMTQTLAWNDGLWGRELRKRMQPKFDADTMKLAEEIINQQRFQGKGRKIAQLKNERFQDTDESW